MLEKAFRGTAVLDKDVDVVLRRGAGGGIATTAAFDDGMADLDGGVEGRRFTLWGATFSDMGLENVPKLRLEGGQVV